jgi:hypothetical protein
MCWRARLPATPEMCSIGMSEAGDATTMVMDTGRLWFSYPILAGSDSDPREVVWTVTAQGKRGAGKHWGSLGCSCICLTHVLRMR